MARKRKKMEIDEFLAYAERNNMTYAQAQIKETCGMIEKMVIPTDYTKIGDRRGKADERKELSESGCET